MKTGMGMQRSESVQKMLDSGKKKYAWQVINEFHDCFGKELPAEYLWVMLSATMQIDSEEITGKERGNFLHFYEQCVGLFAAVDVLNASD